jgi:predicted Zn-dependent protease
MKTRREKIMSCKKNRLHAILLAFAFAGCAGFFETTGRWLVSEEDERKLGRSFHQHLLTNDTARQQYPVYQPPDQAGIEMQSYVHDVFSDLVGKIPEGRRPGYPFTLTILDSKEENAFAVPGGYVYLTTGILSSLQSEAELAGVLGHEIAHITGHHYREALARNAALSAGLQVLLAGTDAGQVATMGAGLFHQLAGLRFSRGNERDADEHGTYLLASTGRNPLGIANYFARMEGQPVPEWLSTHPGPENRVEFIHDLVEGRPQLEQLAADSLRTSRTQRFQENVSL